MTTKTKVRIHETLTLTLPTEIVEDLNKIAKFNETNTENLVYTYIVDGIAGDSRDARRMRFTEKANEALGKSNRPSKTVEEIFDNLVY